MKHTYVASLLYMNSMKNLLAHQQLKKFLDASVLRPPFTFFIVSACMKGENYIISSNEKNIENDIRETEDWK